MIKKKELPKNLIFPFIKKQLLSSGGFACAIEPYLSEIDGHSFTFASEELDDNVLLDFENGGKVPQSISHSSPFKRGNISGAAVRLTTTEDFLSEILSNFLEADPANMILFENSLAKSTDSWLETRKSEVFFLSEEVIHFLANAEVSLLPISLSESNNVGSSFIFLTRIQSEINDGEQLTKSDISFFGHNLQAIIIRGIYDGESFLFLGR
ncbi:MAG: hypothetical protein ACKOX6_10980 [Bdellovibrio sp.]